MKTRTRVIALVAAGSVALAVAPALGAITIPVKTTTGLMFAGMPTTLKPGTYTFKYTNTSGIIHNLKVGDKTTATFATGTKSVTVTLKKGKVAYLCSVPGHAAAGMKGTITVK